MYQINHTAKNELLKVQKKITKELASEKIIQDIYEYIFQAEGKKTRALISLLASQSKAIKPMRRIELASIIELLHTATLVHDDVVDNSNLRRGEQSVNRVWSNSYSVLIGDFIYSKAFMLMVKVNQPLILKELADATNDIARGEIIQLSLYKNSFSLELKDLLKVSYLKTGRLFEAAAKSGAMLAHASDIDVKNFGLLGKTLGIAFQIQDDILDYESLHIDTGKTALQDFQEGKVTFPLFFALHASTNEEKEFLLRHLGNKKLSKTLKKKVFAIVRAKAPALEAESLLNTYLVKTRKSLEKLSHHTCYQEMLNLIIFSSQRRS
jgi:octaprenyl-diphosphate synthase